MGSVGPPAAKKGREAERSVDNSSNAPKANWPSRVRRDANLINARGLGRISLVISRVECVLVGAQETDGAFFGVEPPLFLPVAVIGCDRK